MKVLHVKNIGCILIIVCLGMVHFFTGNAMSIAMAETAVSVDNMVFARAVESRQPLGVSTEFDESVRQVFCWTKLTTQTMPVTIRHVWHKDGQKVLEVPLVLKHSTGRYWSQKNVTPGQWRVDVVSDDGRVLDSAVFKVK